MRLQPSYRIRSSRDIFEPRHLGEEGWGGGTAQSQSVLNSSSARSHARHSCCAAQNATLQPYQVVFEFPTTGEELVAAILAGLAINSLTWDDLVPRAPRDC